jgi:hypothetical protein
LRIADLKPPRETGYLFKQIVLDNFLNENNLSLMIRSWNEGFDHPFGKNGGCIPVFSNSDYCGIGNDAAIAKVGEVVLEVLKP